MCGIFGIFSKTDLPSDEMFIELALTQKHRGPDNLGYFIDRDAGIGLCHNRLSILDLSYLGNQPMISRSGRYTIVFNGEIYNHLELRLELKKTNSNANFLGTSDTETILELFEQRGIKKSLLAMNGMFALAVWDNTVKKLIVARDRIGEKPLYIGNLKSKFIFCSELKPILKGFPYEIENKSIPLMLSLGYIPQPYSIIKNIFKVPPGTFLSIGQEDFENDWNLEIFHSLINTYWSIEDGFLQNFYSDMNSNGAIDQLDFLLRKSVQERMLADVKVGACLSGGVDSSLIVALMQQCSGSPINTYTVGFENQAFNEAGYAKKIAAHLGARHTEVYLTASESLRMIPDLAKIYDEPFGDASQLPTLLVARALKSHVTVALGGDGGDEFFMGYSRYNIAPKLWSMLKIFNDCFRVVSKNIPNEMAFKQFKLWRFMSRLSAPDFQSFYSAFSSVMPCPSLLLENQNNIWDILPNPIPESLHSNYSMMAAVDMKYYLPDDILVKVDRASMHYGLEMRAPFLDHRVMEFAMRLPTEMKIRKGDQKWVCKQLLERYVPKNLFDRPKQGFGVPLSDWLTADLQDWVEHLLRKDSIDRVPGLKSSTVLELWRMQKAGKSDFTPLLWNLLMLLAWFEEWQS